MLTVKEELKKLQLLLDETHVPGIDLILIIGQTLNRNIGEMQISMQNTSCSRGASSILDGKMDTYNYSR